MTQQNVSILLVESNPNHQAMYKIMLGKIVKANIELAKNELEAVLVLQLKKINLVIIGDGILTEQSMDMVRFIKTLPGKPSTPVIKISSSLSKNDLIEFVKLGVNDVILTYGFNINVFSKKVCNILSKSSTDTKFYEKTNKIGIAKTSTKPIVIKQEETTTETAPEESATVIKQEEPSKERKTPKFYVNISYDEAISELKKFKPAISESFLEKKLAKISTIEALPFIISELLNLTSSVNTDIRDLARLIETDYALTARVLKLSNSAFYKRSGSRVLNLNDAIRQVGFFGLRDLALAVGAIKALEENTDGSDLDRLKLWHNSFTKAVAAKEIATLMKHKYPESCFVTGLLSDVGIAIFKDHFSKYFDEVLETCQNLHLPLLPVEKKLMGYYHNEISFKVLKLWNFPQNIIAPINFAHLSIPEVLNLEPEYNKLKTDILIIKLADELAKALSGCLIKTEFLNDITDEVFTSSHVDITQDQFVKHIPEIKNIARELMQIMLLHVDPEAMVQCDMFERYKTFTSHKCLLADSKLTGIPVLEIILNEIKFKVRHVKNPVYCDEMIKTDSPHVVIFDIIDEHKDQFPSALIEKIYNKHNKQGSKIFCITSSKKLIETYYKEFDNPDNFIYMPKPPVLGDVFNFLDQLMRQVNKLGR